jgi:hypothetical protein
MITGINTNITARFPNLVRIIDNRTRNDIKNVSRIIYDKIEISKEARVASENSDYVEDKSEDEAEEKPFEYKNTSATSQTDKTDDDSAAEGRRKLVAIRIALRISRGDNVPLQDHRFLAEYDSTLYKTALKASLIADNKNPKDYESLVDEMLAEEYAAANRDSQSSEYSYDDVAVDTTDIEPDSIDIYY